MLGAVKEVMKKLLQAWLQFTEGDVLELLHRLDVENCPEVAIPVLNAVFSLSPLHELVQNCKHLDSRYADQSSFPKDILYKIVKLKVISKRGAE